MIRCALLLVAACGSTPAAPPHNATPIVPAIAKDAPAPWLVLGGAKGRGEGMYLRTFDVTVASVAPVAEFEGQVLVADEMLKVQLDGTVKEDRTDPESPARTSAILTDAGSHVFWVGLPAGIAIDLRVGQHLRGKVTDMIGSWAGGVDVELRDDAGDVFLFDPGTLDIDAAIPQRHGSTYDTGGIAPRARDDGEWSERHFVVAKLPDHADVRLAGWERIELAGTRLALYGEDITVKPGAEVNDFHESLTFARIREHR